MNLKFLFITILAAAISISMMSCNSDSSAKEKKSDEAGIPVNKNIFVEVEKLPKSASRLYNLPANVKGFVQRNYPGYIITIAVSEHLCGGGDAADVAITKVGSPDLSLIFKPDGTYVEQEQVVPLHSASIAIIHTLKVKYPDFSPGSQIKKLTLADNAVEYSFDLNKGAKSKEVIFDTNGIVVCEN